MYLTLFEEITDSQPSTGPILPANHDR